MNDEINYKNNPLNGVGLKQMLTEIVDHYGFEILYAYLNINCFKNNPSLESAVKFLKKTQWAREKVEAFYMYQYKSLPRASADQFELPPRDRIVPDGDVPGEPAELSIEDAEERRETKARKAAEWDAQRRSSRSDNQRARSNSPWGNSGGERSNDRSDRRNNSGDSGSWGRAEKKSKPSSRGGKPDPWGNFKK
ncbi:VF530 family DNA-binding protein [uncultured Pseudoteredinibacter sp.]|uniref:VF530 family protein n=1 Tax=uncultured Pseudoteredinibacter sp. TaxID=1641701 RepID=UPI00262FC3A0|nr:VF530 family DNA-binding protein [uncultured Pseudoteredinibacter sp.]